MGLIVLFLIVLFIAAAFWILNMLRKKGQEEHAEERAHRREAHEPK